MKNLKKVLALALAFVMCFTMFAGAAVYTDVPAGSDYSEAVTLLSDLGVIAGKPDGSYGVNDTITRADAACLIARLLTGETTPSKYAGTSNFTDVAKDAYYESSVAYCALLGITSGTGNGKFEPLRTITDGEFVAMVTRALGYDTAENPLQFPMGNIQVAQAEGLLDGVNCVATSPALRGEDAQIIYNALFADFDRVAKNENIYQGSNDHQNEYTIAEEVFDLARLAVEKDDDADDAYFMTSAKRDEVTCIAHTWVVAGVDARESADTYTAFMIKDKDDELQADEAITFKYTGDVDSILGYQVELWGDTSHSGEDLEVVAVKTVKGQTGYDWNISMGDDDDIDELTVGDDKEVDAEEAPIAVINLDKDGIYTDTDADDAYDIEDFADTDWDNKDGDSYRLVDWDSDDEIDFVIKTTRKYAEITDIDKDDVAFKALDKKGNEIEESFEIDDDNLKFECEGIEEEDVVEMTVSRYYDKKDGEVVVITMTEVKSDVKELDKVSTKGELEMTFDGDVYKLAEYEDDAWDVIEDDDNDLDEDNLEENYELWLDANGYIIKMEESDGDNTGYLVVLEAEDGDKAISKSKSDKAALKVKLDDNTVDVYDVDFDLDVIDKDKEDLVGTGNNDLYDDDEYEWVHEENLIGQVFKYWMDSDKEITKLQRVAETTDTYTKYAENTGVVTVAGNTKNVYLKKADVLFVTDDNFVTVETDKYGAKKFVGDEDKVTSIEPTTANLKKIDSAVDTGKLIAAANCQTNFYTQSLFAGKMIAYDKDKENYAEAALMVIDNYDDFDKSTRVALITDVSAKNKKNTIFEVEGAIDGKVDTIATVEEDDGVDEMFYKYNINTGKNDPYDSLKDLRDDIDDNGLYAEVTVDADGKITKVVVLDEAANGNLVGPNKAVVRLVAGPKDEVTEDYVSFVSDDNGENNIYYYDKENIYAVGNVAWDYNFNVDSDDTQVYTIDTKVKDILKANNADLLLAANGLTDEPKLSTGKLTDIAYSTIKNNSEIDKYAVMDVAFDKDDINAANANFALKDLDDEDAEAVFTFTKNKFGEVEAKDTEATVKETEVVAGVNAQEGEKQETTITFDGTAEVGSEQNFYVYVGGKRITVTSNGSEDAATLAEKAGDALKADADVVALFEVEVDASQDKITLTAKEAAENIAVTVNGKTVADTVVVKGVTAEVEDVTKGKPEIKTDTKAKLVLTFTSAINAQNNLTFKIDVKANDGTTDTKNITVSTAGKTLSAAQVAELAETAIANEFSSNDWTVTAKNDTVTIECNKLTLNNTSLSLK